MLKTDTLIEAYVLDAIYLLTARLGRSPTDDDLQAALLPNDPLSLTDTLADLSERGVIRTASVEPDGPTYLPIAPAPQVGESDVHSAYQRVQVQLVAELDRLLRLLTATRDLWSAWPPQPAGATLDPVNLLATLEHQFLPDLYAAASHWRAAVDDLPDGSFAAGEALEDTRRALDACGDAELERLAQPDDD